MIPVLNPTDALALVQDQMMPSFTSEKAHLDVIDDWASWRQETPTQPQGATRELRRLTELSRTPWLALVVTTVAQAMFADGYRSPEAGDNSGAWRTWNANNFDARQTAIHRAALTYGQAYVTVLPGEDADGPRAVMRGVSPRKMLAAYEDPASDEWPQYALHVTGNSIKLYDDEAVHILRRVDGELVYGEPLVHGAGVCPVVRYTNLLDLDGRTVGEVEPYIDLAARINKTSLDRLTTQHFNSWKVRTIAGLAEFASTEEEANLKKLQLRQDDILIAEDPDTKFGTLPETPLSGFTEAWRSDIEALAAVSQTPSHNLTGQMVNLSAEALAAARAPLTQKIYERQTSFGNSHAQALRLAAHLEGDEAGANDVMSRVTWQDMEIRSMAQAVDALGKAAQMLQIPPQELWGRIPGVTKSDVDEWKVTAASTDPVLSLSSTLAAQGDADY